MQVFVLQSTDEYGCDDAVFIQNHGVGISAATAQRGVVAFRAFDAVVGCEGDKGIGIILAYKLRCGVIYHIGVNCDHIHRIGIIRCDLIEIGKLVNAGGTPGSPEVHNGDLAGLDGVDGLPGGAGFVQDLQVIPVAQVADLVALGGLGIRRGHTAFVPVHYDGADQHDRHDTGGNATGDKPLFLGGVFLCQFFVGFQQDLRSFPLDGFGRTNAYAGAAADAFLVTGAEDIHLAVGGAQTAVGAFALFHLDAENGDLIK